MSRDRQIKMLLSVKQKIAYKASLIRSEDLEFSVKGNAFDERKREVMRELRRLDT